MSNKRDATIRLIAVIVTSLVVFFCLPLAIVVLIQNPHNYWQWMLTLLLAGPYFSGTKRDD